MTVFCVKNTSSTVTLRVIEADVIVWQQLRKSYVFLGVASLMCCCAFLFADSMESRENTALFIGNSKCCGLREAEVEQAIIKAIESGIRVFLNGGQGRFDMACAHAVDRLKQRYPYIKCYLIIPYHSFSVFNKDLFDEVIYPFEEQRQSYCYFKCAIPERNKMMVRWSSAAVCYVPDKTGGAGKTLEYAQKKKLKIINVESSD